MLMLRFLACVSSTIHNISALRLSTSVTRPSRIVYQAAISTSRPYSQTSLSIYSTIASMSATPSRTLSDFLAAQKLRYLEALKEGKGREWVVAMGNEAGDLDSLASSIAWAWYASTIAETPTVPLAQTPREDLHLRAENLHALALAGFDISQPEVLCADEIAHDPSSPFPSHQFVLVDHNRLQSKFSANNPDARVVAIVDHHEDEGFHLDADPRVIQVPTGSATSLVARVLQERCPDKVPPELATLLLCAILIDTNGLKAGGKAEEADRAAAAFLIPRSLVSSAVQGLTLTALHEIQDVQDLAHTLQTKKADISHLNTRNLLQRDYKEYTMTPSWAPDKTVLVGLSSVPLGLKSWIPRHKDFWRSTEKWMADRGLSVLGILTSFRDEEHMNKHGKNKHRREQLFIVREGEVEGIAERVFEGLQRSEVLDLEEKGFVDDYGLDESAGFTSEYKVRVWKQHNVDATRKVTAPVVKSVIEGQKAPQSSPSCTDEQLLSYRDGD